MPSAPKATALRTIAPKLCGSVTSSRATKSGRSGKDPARSVCDESGRVHGYEGLLVADASVIPTNLGVNPQHTIMALARTFVDRLLEA